MSLGSLGVQDDLHLLVEIVGVVSLVDLGESSLGFRDSTLGDEPSRGFGYEEHSSQDWGVKRVKERLGSAGD